MALAEENGDPKKAFVLLLADSEDKDEIDEEEDLEESWYELEVVE